MLDKHLPAPLESVVLCVPCKWANLHELNNNRDQAPVPLSIFRSNSKFDENSELSGFEYTRPITTIFCTRHDSDTQLPSISLSSLPVCVNTWRGGRCVCVFKTDPRPWLWADRMIIQASQTHNQGKYTYKNTFISNMHDECMLWFLALVKFNTILEYLSLS